jgi:hypothetical protein
VLIAALSLVALFHPNDMLVWAPAAVVLAGLIVGIWRHVQIAPPKEDKLVVQEPVVASAGDLGALAKEARRDIG